VAKVRPEGIRGMEAKSVRKKMKQASFAANVSREDIERGAADLGVELDAHIQFVIDAMAEQADELGLGPR
jgi:predicted hydrolase (HD superfamily)